MKWAANEIEKFDNAMIEKVQAGDYVLNAEMVEKGEEPIIISGEDLEIITDAIPGFEIAGKGNLTVALDITITQVLQNEGNAREFINRIQSIRKEQNFELTDKINVVVGENDELTPSLIEFKAYICREILADTLEFQSAFTSNQTIEVNDVALYISVNKKTI
jgi:isoleucyl-tRNA synthetase